MTTHHPEADKPFAVFPDLHGEFTLFKKALHIIQKRALTGVFLGDYINKGPQSLYCLHLYLSLLYTKPKNIIPLPGNHEAAFFNLLTSPNGSSLPSIIPSQKGCRWWTDPFYKRAQKEDPHFEAIPAVMRSTLLDLFNTYIPQIKPKHHAKLLDHGIHLWKHGDIPLFYRNGTYLCVHAGIDPHQDDPLSWLERQNAYGTSPYNPLTVRDPFLNYQGQFGRENFTLLHGHTPTLTPGILCNNNRINFDGKAYKTQTLHSGFFRKKNYQHFIIT